MITWRETARTVETRAGTGNPESSTRRLTNFVGDDTMPVHDWARVNAGIFHDFHNVWVAELRNAMNEGALPRGYYALVEQHAGRFVPDLLTLHVGPASGTRPPAPEAVGGLAVAELPPKVRRKLIGTGSYSRLRRTLAIRHVSGHRLVAVIEIVSPANKDRAESVREFAAKAVALLEEGVHVLLVDLFSPGAHDARGMHGAIWEQFDDQPYDLPADEPFTLASYMAGSSPEAYVEHRSIGGTLPDMPLFLQWDRYIPAPLESTYQSAYRGVPEFWRDALEGRSESEE
jgi:hypothetical protein